jgi:hypothetical protein
LTKKEQLMAILGAKILANTQNGVESGEAALIHRAGEQGILADIATTIGTAVKKAILIICSWRNVNASPKDIVVDITKDYTPVVMDANTVTALSNELNHGNISYESYMWALQRGELLPPDRTPTEERELIKQSRTGTVVSKDSKITYLNKDDADDILGRDDDINRDTTGEAPMNDEE